MEKESLRKGLKRLEEYVGKQGCSRMFLEENETVPMDTLVVPLKIGEELSVDISCNFVDVSEYGSILQFYGQVVLTEMQKEQPESFAEERILGLLNALNRMIPIGQFLYLADGAGENMIGMRYTLLTELEDERELNKCMQVLQLLMQIYELLCSGLLLLLDGNPVAEVMQTLEELLGQR